MMLDESGLVILDEPFACVDIFTLRDLRPLLRRCFDSSSRTILMFSHRLVFAAYTDYVIVLGEDGSTIEESSTTELARRHVHATPRRRPRRASARNPVKCLHYKTEGA